MTTIEGDRRRRLTIAIVDVELLDRLLVVGDLQELVQVNVIDAVLAQVLWVASERAKRPEDKENPSIDL